MFNVRPPWLFVRPRQPDDSLPGFHVAREALQGVQPDTPNFTIQPYVQDTDDFLRASPGFAGEIRPPGGSGPFDFLTGQSIEPTSPNNELRLPSLTSLLFPRMGEPLTATPGLQDFEPQPEFVPGFHVEPAADDPPGFRVGTSDIDQKGPSDANNWILDYNPDAGVPPVSGSPAADAIRQMRKPSIPGPRCMTLSIFPNRHGITLEKHSIRLPRFMGLAAFANPRHTIGLKLALSERRQTAR
jgi:hypothetical protein